MSSTDATPRLAGGTRILHFLTESGTPVTDSARAVIAAQVAAGFPVAVAARPEVFAALQLKPAPLLRHIAITAQPGLQPGDGESAFVLHKVYRWVDVVHAHGLHAAAVAGLGFTGLPRRLRPAIVATVGRAGGICGGMQARIVRRTATAVLGTTEPACDAYADSAPLVERAQLLRSDLEPDVAPRLSRERVRADLDVPTGSWLVAVPARLTDTPAMTTVLDATSRLPQVRADRRWVVAFTGGGRDANYVAKEFLPHFDHLRLEPEVSSVDTAAAADLVIASDQLGGIDAEGLMQLRRPVIFVGSERAGRVWGDSVPRPDSSSTQAVLHAIEHLIDHPEARVQDGFATRRRVVSDEEFLAADVLEVYAQAIAIGPR